jgi:secreted trypsin-like serine protease
MMKPGKGAARRKAAATRHPIRYFVTISTILALCGCGGEVEDEPSAPTQAFGPIVGGSEAPPGAWPTVVSVTYTNSPSPPWWCGGTLIGSTWVLTAAHCVEDLNASKYRVIVGRHDITSSAGQVVAVQQIVPHPSYVPGSGLKLDDDVALLRLASPVTTAPSRLVSRGRMSEIFLGDDATILGWGRTSEGGAQSKVLRMVTLDIHGVGGACNAVTAYTGVTNNEICIGNLAGGQDSCNSDSGGPAFVNRDNELFLLGATSWGDGCARPNRPGVYAFLPNYFDWVLSIAGGNPSYLPSAQILTVTS